MKIRLDGQIVDLEGSMLGDVINGLRDDRGGLVGPFFLDPFTLGGDPALIEVDET